MIQEQISWKKIVWLHLNILYFLKRGFYNYWRWWISQVNFYSNFFKELFTIYNYLYLIAKIKIVPCTTNIYAHMTLKLGLVKREAKAWAVDII